jgi:hypothetical protein
MEHAAYGWHEQIQQKRQWQVRAESGTLLARTCSYADRLTTITRHCFEQESSNTTRAETVLRTDARQPHIFHDLWRDTSTESPRGVFCKSASQDVAALPALPQAVSMKLLGV